MGRFANNLTLGAVFVALLALGAWQGADINRIIEADLFYRWIISASTQYRLQDGDLSPASLPEGAVSMDQELFEDVANIIDKDLPTPEISDASLVGMPKLVQYAAAPQATQADVGGEADQATVSEEAMDRYEARLEALWDYARSHQAALQRKDFDEFLRKGQLLTAGSQFQLASMYAPESGGDVMVSLGNLFFGLRRMAANLLWLEADKMWHQGHYFRMVPVMKTTVALDPTFVDAFLVGAWHMAYNFTAKMTDTPTVLKEYIPSYGLHGVRVGPKEEWYYRAVDFLEDGIRKNPTNYKIYFDLGYSIYAQKLEDYANSVKFLEMAYRYEHPSWVARMLFRSYRLNEQYEQALAGYERYMESNPDFEQGPRLIAYTKAGWAEKRAKLAQAESAQLLEASEEARKTGVQAEAAPDTTDAARETARRYAEQAAALEAQAKQYRAEARAIWEGLVEEDPLDGLAKAKVLYLQAMDRLHEGRIVEAIALLRHARMESDEVFFEYSDLIIDLKPRAGQQLNISEKKALERRRIQEAVEMREIGSRTFQFRDGGRYVNGQWTRSDHPGGRKYAGWYEIDYTGAPTELLAPEDPRLDALAAALPNLDAILSLARLGADFGELPAGFSLGDRVVFFLDGTWYEYRTPQQQAA